MTCADYKLQAEVECGNIEYKMVINNNTEHKINKLGTQMLYRLYQGSGYVIYYIGVCDDGKIVGLSKKELSKSFLILQKVSNKIDAKLINFIKKEVKNTKKYYMKVIFKKDLNLSLLNMTIHENNEDKLNK